jgi:phage terminase large subunit
MRAFEGAYFAQTLAEARAQGRIGKVSADPLLPPRACIDIGGWCGGRCLHHLNRAVGRRRNSHAGLLQGGRPVLAFHVNWLRSNGHAQAILYLPRDDTNANNITGQCYDEHLHDAGFLANRR